MFETPYANVDAPTCGSDAREEAGGRGSASPVRLNAVEASAWASVRTFPRVREQARARERTRASEARAPPRVAQYIFDYMFECRAY